MKVLVLGGTRFVGPYVIRLLTESGHDVTLFHRGETETDLVTDVRHVHGDFATFSSHLARLRSEQPEVVVDMVPFMNKEGHGVMHFRGMPAERSSSRAVTCIGRLLAFGEASRGLRTPCR